MEPLKFTNSMRTLMFLDRSVPKSSLPNNISNVAMIINTTSSHIIEIVKELQKLKLINIVPDKKDRRYCILELTKKGKEVGKLFNKINDLIKQ